MPQWDAETIGDGTLGYADTKVYDGEAGAEMFFRDWFTPVIITYESSISGESNLTAKYSGIFTLSSTISSESNLTGTIYREIHFMSNISSESSLTSNFLRTILMESDISSESNLTANARKYHVELIEFLSSLTAGDVLVIDSKKKKVTLNGVNVSRSLEGFANIFPGGNEMTYEDNEVSRNVYVRITHKDKYLY